MPKVSRISETNKYTHHSKWFISFIVLLILLCAVIYRKPYPEPVKPVVDVVVENKGPYNYSKIPVKFHCDTKSQPTEKYLTFDFFTIRYSTGLGNQMFEVFAALGMAKSLGRVPFFNSRDRTVVGKLGFLSNNVPQIVHKFSIIPIETENATRFIQTFSCCSYETHPLLKCEQFKFLVIHGNYFQSYKYFENLDVRRFLQPTSDQIDDIRRKLTLTDSKQFKTCVHVRRGDFVVNGVHQASDSNFTRNTISFLKKNKNSGKEEGLFYIFGNDPEWVEENLQNSDGSIRIMRTPSDRAIEDLHFSMLFCDSVLITAPSSTFGFWIGYLSKNQHKVYYRDIFETNDQVKNEMSMDDFYPKSWNRFSMSKTGQISISNL